MQTRRTPLPSLLPVPRRRSSLLSLNSAASPHTPRSSGCFDACPPPVCYAANRKSTDSWNSSNADEMEFDWKPEQLLLLTRTLDALPAHIVTPFHGPIPPSNLLDKIARGVVNAKGPVDWPHSIRATRGKLLDLARARAKEEALAEKRRHVIQEEDAVEIADGSASNYSFTPDGDNKPLRGVGIGPRRPLYRQSSMDFIKPGAADLKDNPNIARLSNRLQRTERTFANPASFHPYNRQRGKVNDENRRSPSPPNAGDVPSLMSPSTPSSTTLNSVSSLSSGPISLGIGLAMGLRPRALRRSASTTSSSSMFSSSASSAAGVAHDPRLHRLRRADSFGSGAPPPPPPKDAGYIGIKRAPSYGTIAQDARAKATAKAAVQQEVTPVKDKTNHVRQISAGSYPSSDEEEKARTKRAKKMRTHVGAEGDVATPPSSVPPSPSVVGSPMASPRILRVQIDRDAPAASPKPRRVMKPYLYSQSMVVDEAKVEVKSKAKVEVKDKPKDAMATNNKERSSQLPSATHRASSSKDKGTARDTPGLPPKDKDAPAPVAVPAPASPSRSPSRLPHRAPRMSAQRNPSMFGAELPPIPSAQPAAPTSAQRVRAPLAARAPVLMQSIVANTTATAAHSASPRRIAARAPTEPLSPVAASPAPTTLLSPATPPLSPDAASPRVRTLRRVRRLAPGRRISFNNLAEEANATAGAVAAPGSAHTTLTPGVALEDAFGPIRRVREVRERGLGSAFQMS